MPQCSYTSRAHHGLRRYRRLGRHQGDAAERSGISEAETIRNAIHLAAMRVRRRSQPLRLRRFASGDPALAERVDDIPADDFRDDPDG